MKKMKGRNLNKIRQIWRKWYYYNLDPTLNYPIWGWLARHFLPIVILAFAAIFFLYFAVKPLVTIGFQFLCFFSIPTVLLVAAILFARKMLKKAKYRAEVASYKEEITVLTVVNKQ